MHAATLKTNNILIQQNIFEWTTEHQKRFEEIKTLLMNNYQTQFQIQISHFMLCGTPPNLARRSIITISQWNKEMKL